MSKKLRKMTLAIAVRNDDCNLKMNEIVADILTFGYTDLKPFLKSKTYFSAKQNERVIFITITLRL